MKTDFNALIEKFIKETSRDYLVREEQLETYLYTILIKVMAETNYRLAGITNYLESSTFKYCKELKRLRKKLH